MKKIYLLGYKKKDSDRRYMREISMAMFLQIQSDISEWICKNMAIKKIYLIYLLTKSCCEAFFFHSYFLLPTRKDRQSRRVDFVTFIVQSYFDTLLRYMLLVTCCRAIVLKVMDQKTLVKRR